MPIDINSSLLSVNLHLGIPEDDENRMQMLVDTGADMDTGNLKYYMWVMSQYPEIVDTFLQCDKDTAYNVVHLLAALNLNDVSTDVNHGQITAVIRYKTLFTVSVKSLFVLPFTLDNDVSARCVLGLPTLLAMGAAIDLVKSLLSCIELSRSFPLDLQPPDNGLPEKCFCKSLLTHYFLYNFH